MPLRIPDFTRRAAQATAGQFIGGNMRFTGLVISFTAAVLVAGCKADMPETAFRTTVKVVDRDTGRPVPGALVLVGARLLPETIAHTAALMRGFHEQVNPAAYAQAGKPDVKSDLANEQASPKDADGEIRLEDGNIVLFTDKKGAVVKKLPLPAKKEKIKVKLSDGKEADGEPKKLSRPLLYRKTVNSRR